MNEIKRIEDVPMGVHGTGDHILYDYFRKAVFPLDKYKITVRLTPNNEFLGIESVEVDKDFMTAQQKLNTVNVLSNIESFYQE